VLKASAVEEGDGLSLPELILKVSWSQGNYTVVGSLKRGNHTSGEVLLKNIAPEKVEGNLALACNGSNDENLEVFRFTDLMVRGKKISHNSSYLFGPVLSTLYTVDDQNYRMTAQLPPISDADSQYVEMEIREMDSVLWRSYTSAKIDTPSYTATFNLEALSTGKDYQYRLIYNMPYGEGMRKNYYYQGRLRHNPVEKEDLTVAAFSCNSHNHAPLRGKTNFTRDNIWFPHEDLFRNVLKHNPDLLVFTGDQIYEGKPTPPDKSGNQSSFYDYLYKWYLFVWSVRDLTKEIPAVTIPDDHDVYHGNLWGEKGKKAPREPEDGEYPEHYKGLEWFWSRDQGGYIMPARFVKMVEKTQCSHLPLPYDETPVKQDIGVYYTDMNFGRISFAIMEDRKFKSAPGPLFPEAKIVNGFTQNRWYSYKKLMHPDARLLGKRQLDFLEDWSSDWQGADMKAVITQTLYANLSTYPDTFTTDEGATDLPVHPKGLIPEGYRKARDMDSNGWPKNGRDDALKNIRKGFGFIIAGDQHLGSIVHHGVDRWDDAAYSFVVPAIGNLWPRRWFPQEPGRDHIDSLPDYTGKYFDAFGNRMNVYAAANPYETGVEPVELNNRAVGYGIVHFNKSERSITMECWPRWVNPSDSTAKQFIGWPKKIDMEDNYARRAWNYLPEFRVSGLDEPPVIQVIDEQKGEVVYTLRIKDNKYIPKVFERGVYTVKIGNPGKVEWQMFREIQSRWSIREGDVINVSF
jgi:phosphodiesterase/alkaline phosphatase D-like protein